MKYIISLILIVFFIKTSNADVGKETGLEIPRYVSLKSNEANIRIGPSKNYPIILKYIKKNYPLKVIEEYQEWRRVEDFNKNIGWIHKSLISGFRTGLIVTKNNNYVKISNTQNGNIIGEVGPGNIAYIKKCKTNLCLVTINDYKGWIDKKFIWGIKKKEIIKINFFQKFEDLYWKSINSLDKFQNKF